MWDPESYEDTDYGLDPGESFEPEDAWGVYGDVSTDVPHVMTVLGPIEPTELGVCLVHEHLLSDPAALAAKEPDFRLDREDLASDEIEAFVAMGGRAIVEWSTRDYGRDAAGLLRLAMRAPVHIVAVTGRDHDVHARRMQSLADVESLADEFVADLREGMDRTTARAGVIRIGTRLDRMTEVEDATIRAAAAAHLMTGAPITTHTESGATALAQLELLGSSGVPPSRVIVGHMDRNLEWDHLVAVAETGVFIAFDQVSKSVHKSDADRAAMLVRLAEAGYRDQLLISHGHRRRSDYISYGGKPGMTYVLERFTLELMEAGAEALLVRNMLIENPARALTISPTPR